MKLMKNTFRANRFGFVSFVIALVLVVAGCAAGIIDSWQCDVTITVDDRTASGSGSGSTQEEAERAALAVACPKLGLTGERLNPARRAVRLASGRRSRLHGTARGPSSVVSRKGCRGLLSRPNRSRPMRRTSLVLALIASCDAPPTTSVPDPGTALAASASQEWDEGHRAAPALPSGERSGRLHARILQRGGPCANRPPRAPRKRFQVAR